jgi:hypothetical protein
MTQENIMKILNDAWEMEGGFFYEVRNRKFDLKKGTKLHHSLKSFELNVKSTIDRNLVRLLWYIPIYLEYQKDILKSVLIEEEYLDYIKLANGIQEEIERLLGYP